MAVLTDTDELAAAWTALASQRADTGFLTIALGRSSPRFRAGIHYPEGAETLLVGFNTESRPRNSELPEGTGFRVHVTAEAFSPGFKLWICVGRQPGAGYDLFVQMAADVVASLSSASAKPDSWLLTLMLARIRAWQEFMRRPRPDMLSPEEELGLFGELSVLEHALAAGAAAGSVVPAWVGPHGGLQDFQTETVGLEVKTTLSVNGFPARISSLEQLDTGAGKVVLLAAVRLCLQEDGRTLPEIIDAIRAQLSGSPHALASFARAVLLTGYIDDTRDLYKRRFTEVTIRVFEVDDRFPALTRSSVRPEIRSAAYEIDADLVGAPALPLIEAISSHGVFS